MWLNRQLYIEETLESIRYNPVTAILGPRQCGKTTLARMVQKEYPSSVFFDLEDPADFELFKTSPKNLLQSYEGLIIIDEIQLIPELFRLLRVLADEPGEKRKYLILGSASPDLIQKSSESLAGRISFVNLTGFRLDEIGIDKLDKLWIRGAFPRSYLADSEKQSYKWRNNFTQTFLERDISQFGFNIPPVTLRRFWQMLAHYHGQVWNGADFARSMGVSEPTVKRYLDILTGTFMVRQLQPWHENLKKRQVKAPRIYIRDSGIVHSLLMLERNSIVQHVKVGASWEGFIIEQLIQLANTPDSYFWKTHAGSELDLFIIKEGKRFGFEVKYTEVPKPSKSMHMVLQDLRLHKLYVIYRGSRLFEMEEKIIFIPATQLLSTSFFA